MRREVGLAPIDAEAILWHERVEVTAVRLDPSLHPREAPYAQHSYGLVAPHQSQTMSLPRQMRHLFLITHQMGTHGRRTMS